MPLAWLAYIAILRAMDAGARATLSVGLGLIGATLIGFTLGSEAVSATWWVLVVGAMACWLGAYWVAFHGPREGDGKLAVWLDIQRDIGRRLLRDLEAIEIGRREPGDRRSVFTLVADVHNWSIATYEGLMEREPSLGRSFGSIDVMDELDREGELSEADEQAQLLAILREQLAKLEAICSHRRFKL